MTFLEQNIDIFSQTTGEQNRKPLCIITDLKNNIILSSLEVRNPSERYATGFFLNGCKVSVTRFWSSSTAHFTYSQNLNDIRQANTLPPGIGLEDQIMIYMGYLPENQVQVNSIDRDFIKNYAANVPAEQRYLSRVYVGIIEVADSVHTEKGVTFSCQCRDRMKWLMDTQTTFDPNAILGQEDVELKEAIGNLGEVDGKLSRAQLVFDCARYGILAVSSGAEASACGCGVRFTPGVMTDLFKNVTFLEGESLSDEDSFVNWYTEENLLALDPYADRAYAELPLSSANVDLASEEGDVEEEDLAPVDDNAVAFNIYTTRDSLNVQQRSQFIVAQQIPAEMIKFLAMQETYPTELFQHNISGELFYAPRGNNSINLSQSKHNYRLYFVSARPAIPANVSPPTSETEPATRDVYYGLTQISSRNHALSYKEEMASIGLKTNIIVRSTQQVKRSGMGDFVYHLQTNPFELRGKDFACKTMIYQDETLTNATEASVVAINVARILSKETRAATLSVVGDPSLLPGEIIQVAYASFNRVPETNNLVEAGEPALSNSAYPTFEQLVFDRLAYELGYERSNTSFKDMVQRVRDAATDDDLRDAGANVSSRNQVPENELAGGNVITLPNGERLVFNISDSGQASPKTIACENRNFIFNDDTQDVSGTAEDKDSVGYRKEPQTIWRIDGVIHEFNAAASKGFKTTVALTSPF